MVRRGLHEKVLCGVLAVLSGAGVGGMLLARVTGHDRYALPSLILGSTFYVLIGVIGGGLRSWYGRGVLVGLVFCWLGDCFGPGNFLLGLYFFVIAHLGFVAAFCARGLAAKRSIAALVIWLAVGGGIFGWLYPHVPADQRGPIFGYMVIITAMMTFAGGTRGGAGSVVILIAAMAFYVSDVFLARSRFVSPGFTNTVIGYPLYYAACILFAFTVFPHAAKSSAKKGSDR